MKRFKFPITLSLYALKKIYNELIDGFTDRNLSNLIVNGDLKFKVKHSSNTCLYKWFATACGLESNLNITNVGYNVSSGFVPLINQALINDSGNFCGKLSKEVFSIPTPRTLYQTINLPEDSLDNGQVSISIQYRLRNGTTGAVIPVVTGADVLLTLTDLGGSSHSAVDTLTEISYHVDSEINTLQKTFAVTAAGQLQAKVNLSVEAGAYDYYIEIIDVTVNTGRLSATSLLKQRNNTLDCIKYQNGTWQMTNDAIRYFKINGINKQVILIGTDGVEDNGTESYNGIEDNNGTPVTIRAAITEFGANKVYVLTSNITLDGGLVPPANSIIMGNGYTINCANNTVLLSNASCQLQNVNFTNVNTFTITGSNASVENCSITLQTVSNTASGLILSGAGATGAKIIGCRITEKISLVNAQDCYIENVSVSVANSTVNKSFVDLSSSIRNFISFHAILTNLGGTINMNVINIAGTSQNNTINLLSYLDSNGGDISEDQESELNLN